MPEGAPAQVGVERQPLAAGVEYRQHRRAIADARHEQRRFREDCPELAGTEALHFHGDGPRLGRRARTQRDLAPHLAAEAAQAAHAIDPLGARADVAGGHVEELFWAGWGAGVE